MSTAKMNFGRALVLAALLAMCACKSGGGNGNSDQNAAAGPGSSNWDALVWDQGNWN